MAYWLLKTEPEEFSWDAQVKRGKNGEVGPPVHDDLFAREFTADRRNRLWLADITEHATAKAKLDVYAMKTRSSIASSATASLRMSGSMTSTARPTSMPKR